MTTIVMLLLLLFLSAIVSSCSGFVIAPMTATNVAFRQQQQQRNRNLVVPQQMAMTTSSSSYDNINDNNNDNDNSNSNKNNDNNDNTVVDRRKVLIGAVGILSSSLITTHNYRAIAADVVPPKTKEFPVFTLPNNVRMPVLALNTAGMSTDDTARACAIAASNGFRHFDFHPGIERDGVARFLKDTKIPRTDLFLTTKIRKPAPGTTPEEAAELASRQIDDDLVVLGGKSVDMLMLRDSPDCAVMRAQWKVLEQALDDGKTRSVGVINYCEESIRCLLKTARVKPAVNYYYYHVGMNSGRGKKLRDFCDRKDIRTFAYGALGEPGPYTDDRILTNSVLKQMGDGSKVYNRRNHGDGDKSPEEIAIKWVIDSGAAVSVRPTSNFGLGRSVCSSSGSNAQGESECEMGIRKRSEVFDWNLTGEEIYKLSNIPSLRSEDNPTIFSSSGCPGERPIP